MFSVVIFLCRIRFCNQNLFLCFLYSCFKHLKVPEKHYLESAIVLSDISIIFYRSLADQRYRMRIICDTRDFQGNIRYSLGTVVYCLRKRLLGSIHKTKLVERMIYEAETIKNSDSIYLAACDGFS